MIMVVNCLWLYSKVFRFWEICRLPSFSTRHLQAPKNNPGTFHRPAGAQRLRRPAWKRTIPLWFHDVPHGWRPEAFTRQHASMAGSRQNDTRPTQPSQPPMASQIHPRSHKPIADSPNQLAHGIKPSATPLPDVRNGQLRSMASTLSASSRSHTPMADRIAWLRDGMADVTRATDVEKRRNNSR